MDALTFNTASTAGRQFLAGVIPPEWYHDQALLREFLTSFFTPSTFKPPPLYQLPSLKTTFDSVLAAGRNGHPHPPQADTLDITKLYSKIPLSRYASNSSSTLPFPAGYPSADGKTPSTS
jgi:hypothetical protein